MIAIIEKIGRDHFFWEKLLKRRENLMDVLSNYSGFEGNLIECLDGSDRDEDISLAKGRNENFVCRREEHSFIKYFSAKNSKDYCSERIKIQWIRCRAS